MAIKSVSSKGSPARRQRRTAWIPSDGRLIGFYVALISFTFVVIIVNVLPFWRLVLDSAAATAIVMTTAATPAAEPCHRSQSQEQLQQQQQLLLKPSYKAEEIVDPTCSSLPDSVKELDFPLRTPPNKQGPSVWLFDSGVKLKVQYLSKGQLQRFWKQPETSNYWETADEPIMMEAIQKLYPRCQTEQCLFVDGGAAFGYYSQLIRLHFPLVRVLAFNPHPQFCREMLDNLALAHVTTGVCLQQVGLSDKSGGTVPMPYGTGGRLGDNRSGGGGKKNQQPDKRDAKGVVQVPIASLDDYYDKFVANNNKNSALVVFVKLDVEGHAGKVIRGAPKMMAAAQNVLVGLHNADETRACQSLSKLGFTNVTVPDHSAGTPNSLCLARRG